MEFAGFEVSLTVDGAEALAAYEEAVSAGGPPHVGGRECLTHLHRIDPDLVAIASSGYARNQVESELLDLGFAAFLRKPYSVADLRAILGQVFEA